MQEKDKYHNLADDIYIYPLDDFNLPDLKTEICEQDDLEIEKIYYNNKLKEITYKKDNNNFYTLEYYDNGDIKYEDIWTDQYIITLVYYPNQKGLKRIIVHFKDQEMHFFDYYKNGQLRNAFSI